MMMIRFKVLAAGVMIATGLGLSVGSGWYGSATAQVPDLSEVGGLPAKAPPAKAASNIDEIKAKLATVQAELAEAQKKDVTGKKAPATQLGVRLEQPKSKYEYEPVPATHKDFEAKLAAREQAGWSFVGEVTFHGTDKETLMPTLVFREKLKSATWFDFTQPPTRLDDTQLYRFKIGENCSGRFSQYRLPSQQLRHLKRRPKCCGRGACPVDWGACPVDRRHSR